MSMYKVAVVGDKDSILGFKALGVTTYPVTGSDEALRALNEIIREKVAVVCITEAVAEGIGPQIEELNKKLLPAVVLPSPKMDKGARIRRPYPYGCIVRKF